MSELQGENNKLYSMINQQKSKEIAKRHRTSLDKSYDMSLKTRNMSCEDSPLDDSYRYATYDKVKKFSLIKKRLNFFHKE